MLTIYGADLSSPSNKIRFTANFLGIPYEYKRVSLRDGENRSPEFLKLHPAGKVPVINDDGFVLFESDAIIKYLAQKQNSPIYPKDFKQRALVDQWIDFVTIHVGGAVAKVLFNRVFAPMIKEPVDERSISDGVKFLNRFLPVVENQFGKNRYLSGNELTLADIDLLANLDPVEAGSIDLSPYKNIGKWRKELQQKEFYTKCHKEYGEALKQMAGARK